MFLLTKIQILLLFLWVAKAQNVNNPAKPKEFLISEDAKSDALKLDKLLIENLKEYLSKLEGKITKLRKLAAEFRQPLKAAQGVEEEYLSNPLHSFPLIRHMHQDWKYLAEFMQRPVGNEQIHFLKEKLPELPLQEDSDEATKAMHRMAKTYNVTPWDMAHGLIDGIQFRNTLTALDCFDIGKLYFKWGSFEESVQWLNITSNFVLSSKVAEVMGLHEKDLALLLARSLVELGLDNEAGNVLKSQPDLAGNHTSLLSLFKAHTHEPLDDTPYLPENYKQVCRSSHVSKPSRLHCRYNSTTTPFLILAPLKMEEVSLNPYIVVYHDVVSEEKAEKIIRLGEPRLEPTYIYSTTGAVKHSGRTALGAWIEEEQTNPKGSPLHNLFEVMRDITGLEVEECAEVQLLKYGFGAHYCPHRDYFDGPAPDISSIGDRIATALFYPLKMSLFVEYTEPHWRNLNMRALSVDEAYLYFTSYFPERTYLYTLSDKCYTCPYTKVKTLSADMEAELLRLSSAYALNFKIFKHDQGNYAYDNASSLCWLRRTDLQEFGVYNLTLDANGNCNFAVDKPGVPINYAFLAVFMLVAALLSLQKLSSCAWRSYHYDEDKAAVKATQGKRLRSLDTFRGLSIVLMIFGNSGGGGYTWVKHAAWNGLHFADLVFPSFLWIMGVCIPLSVKAQLSRGSSKLRICLRILWRSIKLFATGICLNSMSCKNLEQLRLMGVLQRFGVASLVVGILHTLCSRHESISPQTSWQRTFRDIHLFRGELVVLLTLVATYLGLTFGLSVPGCPLGYLGPGGKHDNNANPNCIGGAAGYVDLQVLGEAHLYQHTTAKYVYDSTAFDPEGIFGCILSVVQVLLGAFAGVTLLVHPTWQSHIRRWLILAILLGLIGGALCGFSREGGVIPLNKNLWSLSFVCVTVSLALVILSLLYYFVAVREAWSGYPFTECGMNAIAMYVGHWVMHKMLPWHNLIGPMNTHFMLLLEAMWNTLFWIGVAQYLDARDFYYSM